MRSLVSISRLYTLGALALLSLNIMAAPPLRSPSRSAELFEELAQVLQSPRCMNCHTVTSFPRQGDDRHPHRMNVSRGVDDHGATALKCATCHVDHNQSGSGVPGAPKWGLAPQSMGWEGRRVADLCKMLKDPERNGGRSVDDLVKHMTEDPLVQWAWRPGEGRKTPPIAQDPFHDLVRQWAALGADCPSASARRN